MCQVNSKEILTSNYMWPESVSRDTYFNFRLKAFKLITQEQRIALCLSILMESV